MYQVTFDVQRRQKLQNKSKNNRLMFLLYSRVNYHLTSNIIITNLVMVGNIKIVKLKLKRSTLTT